MLDDFIVDSHVENVDDWVSDKHIIELSFIKKFRGNGNQGKLAVVVPKDINTVLFTETDLERCRSPFEARCC